MAVTINGDGLIQVDGTSTTQGRVRLNEDTDNGTNYVELQAPANLAANLTLTMPAADGTNGQYLQTNGSGVLSFSTVSGYAGPSAQVFTSNGTFTIPTGITRLKVTVIGGGGGGGGSTISNGSAGGNSSVASGTQSITTITANGGGGGSAGNQSQRVAGGDGGSATNGDLNIRGGGGGNGSPDLSSNFGGSSSLGGGARAATNQNANGTAASVGYGGGGSGGRITGCGHFWEGAGGGGGATAIKWLSSLTPGNTLSVTIGSGGNAGSGSFNGGAGAAGVVFFEW